MCEACEGHGQMLLKEINGWPIMIAYTPDAKMQIWGPWGCVTDDAVSCHKCGKVLTPKAEDKP